LSSGTENSAPSNQRYFVQKSEVKRSVRVSSQKTILNAESRL